MFWPFWCVDAIVAAIFVYFFVIGLADGSVSSFNMGIWMLILAAIPALLWGSHALRGAGREPLAVTLLGIVAVPAVLVAIFFVVVLIAKPRWN